MVGKVSTHQRVRLHQYVLTCTFTLISSFEVERTHSVAEQGEKWVDGKVRDIVEFEPETRVRLIRKHSLRIVNEGLSDEERQATVAAPGLSCYI